MPESGVSSSAAGRRPGAFANLVLRADLGSKGNLLVLNDEAHHAWRAASKGVTRAGHRRGRARWRCPAAELTTKRRHASGLMGSALIHEARGINRAIDFSATPYYLSGSGHAEGEPFGWIVSDFSLLDAIESRHREGPAHPGR